MCLFYEFSHVLHDFIIAFNMVFCISLKCYVISDIGLNKLCYIGLENSKTRQ